MQCAGCLLACHVRACTWLLFCGLPMDMRFIQHLALGAIYRPAVVGPELLFGRALLQVGGFGIIMILRI